MKILKVIHGIDKNSGGSSTYMKLLAEELAVYAEVTVASLDSGNNTEIGKGVNCFYAPVPHFPVFGYSTVLARFLNRSDADIYHGNGLWQYPVHAMATIATRKHKPYVISPHGMLEPWSLEQGGLKKKLLMQLFQKEDLKDAKVLHATGILEADNIRKMGFKNHVAVIPNGIDVREFFPVPKENSRACKTLLFLSRIHPKKGLELLIDIWSDLSLDTRKNWQVKIAGNGESNYVNGLGRRIRQAGLENEIEIIGAKWDDEKVRLYQQADLFILPSFSENFGIVVLEALACATPVITTKATPWADLNKYGCGWWVDVDRHEIKRVLTQALAMDKSDLISMGLKGRSLVEEKYTIKVVARQMMELYNWVLGSGNRPDFVM